MKSKWAVFYDDGLNGFFDSKEKAKVHAAKLRAEDRANGEHNPCFFKKLTKQECIDFGFQSLGDEYAKTVSTLIRYLKQFYYGKKYSKKLFLSLGDYLEGVGSNIKYKYERMTARKKRRGC